jgi:type II secretory pathway component GspD/PulD (secretin)
MTHVLNILFAPKMNMWNGQVAEIRDTTARPYVTGFKGTKEDAEPQVDEIESGTRLVVRPDIQIDGSIRLNLAIRFSKVGDIGMVDHISLRSQTPAQPIFPDSSGDFAHGIR